MRCLREIAAVSLSLGTFPLSAQTGDPLVFFKDKVQPVLEKQCYSCHTGAALGGLRLDSRDAILKGGASGPAVVAGKPQESLLFQAISGTHAKLKMPPGRKLGDAEIAILREWIEAGLHHQSAAPAVPTGAQQPFITEERRRFWSFQPVRKPGIPRVTNKKWSQAAIDQFILAKLEEKNLEPALKADRRTLLRRVTFDLTGLPPTPEETRAFLRDKSPDAWTKVVDRLLASPRYGERWGRHWLDVVHYAEDDALGLSADPYSNAWRFRDWVIAALNDDMPYDTFVKAQIAGDLMDAGGPVKLAPGVGIFGLGPWYYKLVEPPKAQSDEIHDRVDVLSRGFLGLTVACARCHDHKYDPISNEDYYGLAGVFFNTKYYEYPLAPENVVEEYKSRKKAVSDVEASIKKLLEDVRRRTAERLAAESEKYLIAASAVRAKRADAAEVAKAGLDREAVERWVAYLASDSISHPFLKQFLLASESGVPTAAAEFQQQLNAVLAEQKKIESYNEKILEEAKKSKDPYDLFCVGCNAETKTLDRDKYVLYADLLGTKQRSKEKEPGVLSFTGESAERFLTPGEATRLKEMRADLEVKKKAVPERYPFLHTIADVDEPKDMRLQQRGNPYSLGDPVPRRFLTVLGKPDPVAFHNGSGRRELADIVASAANPLTARVIVNRIWQNHFGTGLVRTPSNFGQMGDRPSHPELLDYLAARLVEGGWSIKKIHREILLTEVYQMSSSSSSQGESADPENRLRRRANRRRLEVEELRDAILAVTGRLDLQMGGPAFEWEKKSNRRTVYGNVSRYRTEKLLSLFDFPDPTMPAEQRVTTNTPLQWLFFLNGDLIGDAARTLAEKAESSNGLDPGVDWLYQQLFSRDPKPDERSMAKNYLGDGRDSGRWTRFSQVLLSSNEFSFID